MRVLSDRLKKKGRGFSAANIKGRGDLKRKRAGCHKASVERDMPDRC